MTVQAELDTARAVEGDEVELVLRLKAETPLERLELRAVLPRGLELAEDEPPAFPLRAGEERAFALPVRCSHFGGYRAGAYVVRAFDRFGLTVDEARVEASLPLAVLPEAEHLQRLLRPVRTQPFAGNQVARTKGDGIEFADIRPFVAGDRVAEHQLARERAQAGAPCQRAPPGAQRRRRPLPRQLCRGARR